MNLCTTVRRSLSLSLLTSDKKLARQFLSFPDLYDSNHLDKTVFIYLFNHTRSQPAPKITMTDRVQFFKICTGACTHL